MELPTSVSGSGLLTAVALAIALPALLLVGSCDETAAGGDVEIINYDGFIGHYYADLTIEEAALAEDEPLLMRQDRFLDFPVERATFGSETGTDHFTVRWNGFVFVPEEGVRGVVVTGLGRAGLLIDGRIVFRPAPDGGLIDERIPMTLNTGWRRVELWYENLDANSNALRFGWLSANADLVPIAGGYIGVARDQLPEESITVSCEVGEVSFQGAEVVITANTVANINIRAGDNDLSTEGRISRLEAELIQLESDSDVTANVTATDFDGNTASTTCEFETERQPPWVEGSWRAEYFDSTDLTEPRGVRFEQAGVARPDDLPFSSNRTEWFPGTGSNTFSARWSAWMLVDNNGTYEITTEADDGIRVFVDNDEVVDDWGDGYDMSSERVELRAGYHEVVVEYYQGFGGSTAGWDVARVTGDGSTRVVAADHVFGEIVDVPDERARVSATFQGGLDDGDESFGQWVEAGCTEALDVALNQPARLETQGEIMLLSLDTLATAHSLCILPGETVRAQVRLTDLDGDSTDWLRVDFERPEPEPEPGE